MVKKMQRELKWSIQWYMDVQIYMITEISKPCTLSNIVSENSNDTI